MNDQPTKGNMMEPIAKENYVGRMDYAYYLGICTRAVENNHQHWIDGIPVAQNLLKFCNELKYKRPDVVWRVDHRASSYNGLGYHVFADLGVAFKDAPDLQCGSIGLDMDPERNILFTVKSDRIQNDKFSEHSEGYRIKRTKNFANAVKNAQQYIKPFVFADVWRKHHETLKKGVAEIRSPALDKIYNATSISKSDLYEEMVHMLAAGYTPKTTPFAEALRLFSAELDEIRELENYKPRECLVWIKPDKVEYRCAGEHEQHIALTPQDVPESIRDKIAVLQISETSAPIKDVGLRVNNTTYWVFE